MSEKIQLMHTQRDAYVYIRQSSMQQVRTRLEGQQRQYDLRERAHALGFQRVTVIDEDLGRSGTGSVEPPGFGRLLTAVCAGQVGAVLALEASRLARNNRDWHHLIDLCAMAGTLVIDHDGVYDPCLLNDRLLLGLKGTMSEFEISLLRQRAVEAYRQKVRRGLVLTQVPVGYIRTEDEGIEKTPDCQIQEVAAEVLEALRPVGIQAAFEALEKSQSQTDEKRRSLELAVQKARYEASRIERQYQATEPDNRLVAAELEKRWNNALVQVAEMERRLEEATITAPQLTTEQRDHLLKLGDDLERLWDHPNSPAALKKRILRTVLEEVVADTKDDPPTVHLKLHWAGGVHTELTVRKNRTGHHDHVNSQEVTELIRELALVCEDSAIVSILNRLGYRTGIANTWTEKRVQHVRHTKGFPACPPLEQRRWITMQQAASALQVSDAVVRRLVMQEVLPARQIVKFSPWMIEREHLDLPAVHRAVRLVHTGRHDPLGMSNDAQTHMFRDPNGPLGEI
ncbi:MAG: recombinase family protein [Silvibacterium sp.]